MTSDLEAAFETYWHALAPGAPEPEREYRFAAVHVVRLGPGIRKRLEAAGLRDWRWDFAWPRAGGGGVAVEVHGGTWVPGKSRHTTGAGFVGDREKINAGIMLGWRTIELTAGMLDNDPARWIAAVRRLVEGRAE